MHIDKNSHTGQNNILKIKLCIEFNAHFIKDSS